MNLAMTLQAKGGSGLAARAGTILYRFGATTGRMERCFAAYFDLVDRYGARPTWPITACVLRRHPAVVRRFAGSGVEFAIHGLVHTDHACMSLETQRRSIREAAGIFDGAGVPYTGFRGPYLRFNTATDDVVRELGMRYHSSQAVAFPVLPESIARSPRATAYRRALAFYGALDAEHTAVRPRNRAGLIDIPVAMPDDEVMVERLHLGDRDQATVWTSILDLTYRRGDLFTLQLHPERIHDCAHALTAMLDAARRSSPSVWIATLDEIARWWQRRGQAAIRVMPIAGGWRAAIDGDPDLTLLVRGTAADGADTAAWWGADRLAGSHAVRIAGDRAPVVGVSTRTSAAVVAFLREEGYAVAMEVAERDCGAWVDEPSASFDEGALLSALDSVAGPLVRLWRWPSGARSALAITGDIDSITLQDFAMRMWEGRR